MSSSADVPRLRPPSVTGAEKPGSTELELHVAGMNCPDCVRRAEERLTGLDGVGEVRGDHVARRLHVRFDEAVLDRERIGTELGRIGFVARQAEGEPAATEIWSTPMAWRTYVAGTCFFAGLAAAVLGLGAGLPAPPGTAGLAGWLFLAAAVTGGLNFVPAGLRSLRGRSLDMNFLMTLAILGAVGIGEYLEAGAIAFLFSVAELLEGYAVDRARRSIHALLDLSPESATVVRDGTETVVPVDALIPGDTVLVRAGDKVPADGVVSGGAGAVDQATITGESMPVEKGVGDEVFAGTVSRGGFLRVRVERAAGDTVLANIVRIVEQAESRKSRSERFVRKFARLYTPAVAVGALLVVAVPTVLLGQPFETWFVRGLTLLVIACPCALVISTPVAAVSGITAAARHGVLIKGGEYFEAMGDVRVVAFDKTGTLTRGHPSVTDVIALQGTESDVLAAAAAVESRSEHPIGRAIVEEARRRDVKFEDRSVAEFEGRVGSGARAKVDGRLVTVGAPELFRRDGIPERTLHELRREGKTAVLVGIDGAAGGILALADRPRQEAKAAVAALRTGGVDRVVMLTGDNRETAEAVARELGLDEALAELKPDEKVEAVERLEARYGPTAMVGDGINDGPALTVARVGIAMGAAGSDVALETADVALMADDLSRVPYVHRLSRTGGRVIRQNIAVSLATKLGLAVGVPFGWVSLVMAVVVGDLGASLAVTLNSLRLARWRPR